jgi:hypothetical protein
MRGSQEAAISARDASAEVADAAAALAPRRAALGNQMQRTAAEHATPHGATLPELPPELVVSIVRAGKDGLVLVKLLQVCKAWRRAIAAESARLWREVALAKYPRLHDVLAFAGAPPNPPCFRSLYREQVAADRPDCRRQSPHLNAYALTVELYAVGIEHGGEGVARRQIARASERLDRVCTLEGRHRRYARMLLTKAEDALVPADSIEFVRGKCSFVLYATRLSDLKTTKVAEIDYADVYESSNHSDGAWNFGRHREEGGEHGIVFGVSGMHMRNISIFRNDDESEPVIYAAFNPSQMQLYVDFWERNRDGTSMGGVGPDGEMFMAEEELQTYLHFHALWSR